MKWKPVSSRKRYCISRFSRMATSTGSAARKVRSSTRPVRTFLSLVRTKAPPLPGLTCWNPTTFMSVPSRFRVIPFLRSLVVGMAQPYHRAERRPARARQVLDPHPAEAGQVHPGLHRHRRPGGEPPGGALPDPGRLVDLQPDPVPGRVAERLAEAG